MTGVPPSQLDSHFQCEGHVEFHIIAQIVLLSVNDKYPKNGLCYPQRFNESFSNGFT